MDMVASLSQRAPTGENCDVSLALLLQGGDPRRDGRHVREARRRGALRDELGRGPGVRGSGLRGGAQRGLGL